MLNDVSDPRDDRMEINQLIHSFFDLFDNRDARPPELERIFALCIPQGIIIKSTAQPPEISTLVEFITPRQILLTNGTLTDFAEQELSESTFIFGNIAHRVSNYQKSGILNGEPFSIRGMKSFQFVRTTQGWRISAIAWDDEREGLSLSGPWVATDG